MFCGNCGAENNSGAKFCKGCGKSLENGGSQGSTDTPNANVSQFADKIKAIPKNVLIGACAAVIALVVMICVVANSGKTIKLDDYLTVDVSGYDGYGTAKAIIDWNAMEEKYGAKLSFTSVAKSEYGGLIHMITPMDVVQDYISVHLEKNSALLNGDTIVYTWKIGEDLSKYVNGKVKFKDASITVSGLTEVGTFDAFADLAVEFSGVSPNGNTNLNYTGAEMSAFDFKCDKRNELSNGDTIKVTIDDSRLEYYAEKLGKVPEELEKEYEVDGLDSYLMKFSEMDDSTLASMQSQATDAYNAHVARDWGEGAKLESLTYIGNYLLTAKDKDTWYGHNYLYLIYKAQVRNTYSNNGESYNKLNDNYWFIRYDELMVSSDGTIDVDVNVYSTPRDGFKIDSGIDSGWWSTMSWHYSGYNTLEELYKVVVMENVDSYNYEDNVDESVAPETIAEEERMVEGGFVIPDSDLILLVKSDLEGLTAEQCKIARNEIYARHGRMFQDEELQSYFNLCDWYEGIIDSDDFEEASLTDIELANRDLIVEYEGEMGYW